VGEVVIGYPKDISRKHGNKLTTNFWNYGYVIKRFEDVGEELGIKIVKVGEGYSSKNAPYAGKPTRVGALSVVSISVPHREGHKCRPERCDEYPTYPRVPRSRGRGLSAARDRGNGLKTQPAVTAGRAERGGCWTHPPAVRR
jgi:putative transposase